MLTPFNVAAAAARERQVYTLTADESVLGTIGYDHLGTRTVGVLVPSELLWGVYDLPGESQLISAGALDEIQFRIGPAPIPNDGRTLFSQIIIDGTFNTGPAELILDYTDATYDPDNGAGNSVWSWVDNSKFVIGNNYELTFLRRG